MKRKLMFALVMLILGFGVTACGKKADGDMPDKPKEESGIEHVEDADIEPDHQPTLPDAEIAARMENFSVGGFEIGLPCTVGDFMEKFELEYSFPMPEAPDTICCSYLIDGEPAGVIFVYCKEEKVHDTDYVYAMSVDEFSIVKEQPFAFEVSGITEDMTREQVEELWGEPEQSGTESIVYCDGKNEDDWYVDKIMFYFDDTSGKISQVLFFVSLDRIEER